MTLKGSENAFLSNANTCTGSRKKRWQKILSLVRELRFDEVAVIQETIDAKIADLYERERTCQM